MDTSTDHCACDDRRMHLSYQVLYSVIFKQGHTRRNQRWVSTTAMDRHRGIIAWLSGIPDPTRLEFIINFHHYNSPTPHFTQLLHYSSHSPSIFNFHILSLNHCPHTILHSPKSYNLLVGAAAVGVFLATEYLSIYFSPFLRYVSLIVLIYLAFLFIS